MKKIGIKLADGSFYPIMEEGSATKKELNVTTVKDNQTTVKVGLYSSENSSMQDATYLDTLKISNLKKQPNGAPTIKLSLGLDDEGRLSAELVDSETGREAKTSVELLSNVLGNDKNPGTGKGLLNAAEEINASDGIAVSEEAASSEELPSPGDAPFAEESALPEDLDLPDDAMLGETPSADEDFSLPEETQIEEAGDAELPSLDEEPLPDIGEDSAQDETALSEEDLSLPDDAPFAEESAPSEDFDLPEESALSEDLNLPDEAMHEETPAAEEEFSMLEETPVEEAGDDTLPSLDEEPLPDIGEDSAQDENALFEEELDLPDFDENIFSESTDAEDSMLPQSEIQEAFGTSGDKLDFSDMDFEMPDFGESASGDTNFGDLPDFNSANDDLDDLFSDDENFSDESEKSEKTQKWPMVICLICALICVLAVLSLLFIIPSKFNVFNSLLSQDEKTQIKPAQEVTERPLPVDTKVAEIQVPIVPAAKEDEVVVIPQAELVVPDLPYGEETKRKTKEILYKIKWGDTLWDLSATYYKNPWLYPKIAKYNDIKNPNYIVAGTYIKIPEE